MASVVSLRWMGTAAAAGPSALVIWAIALAAFFVPLAFTVLELSSRFPAEGGIYVWVREAFGERAGFLTGWAYWTSNLPYFPTALYFGAEALLHLGSGERAAGAPFYFVAVSLGGLALAVVMNLVGLEIGKWLHNLAAVATWVPVGILVAASLQVIAGGGWRAPFAARDLAPALGLREIAFWSTIAFAFAGVEAASLLGEEIRDAGRAVPRAVLIAGALITGVYLAGTAAILVLLPGEDVNSLTGIMRAIAHAAERLGVGFALPAMALLLSLAAFGNVSAWFAAAARLPFAAGLDHALPPAFAKLHPRFGTPWVSLVTMGALTALFVVLGQAGATVRGAFEVFVSLSVISFFLPYLYMFLAMIRVQGRPAGPEVRRVPGGRPAAIVLAGLGFATTSIAILLALIPPAGEAHPGRAVAKIVGGTLLIVSSGMLLHWRMRRFR